MCTMTWFVDEQGYQLFFNRDERTSRKRADIPKMQQQNGVRYIAPTDADAGGTWIAVNQFGITVCLLNYYQFEQIESYQEWVSRGEVVRQFADTSNINTVENALMTLSLNDYRAFRLFVIDPQGKNRLCVWDGHRSRIEYNVSTPKSSSSVNAKQVKQVRKQYFSELGLADNKDIEAYRRFHASHYPEKSQESVCMHRQDANTVRFSNISVVSQQASFAYADGPPCSAVLGSPVTLPLQRDESCSSAKLVKVVSV